MSTGKVVIPHSRVMLLRLITAATAVADGYDLGVVNGVSMILSNTYETKTISFFVSIMPAFVGLGALVGAYAADMFGRKPVLIISYVLLVIGAALMGIPSTFALLMTGRAIVGFGIGVGGVVGTVYMAEISPTKSRGSFVAQESLFLSIGLLLGYLSNYALMSYDHNYNLMLGLGAVLPACCLIALLTVGRDLPESPHWERMKRRQAAGTASDQEAASLTPTDDLSSDHLVNTPLMPIREVIREFFASPGAFSALMIGVLQPLCGIGPILYFSDMTFSAVETAGKSDGAIVDPAPVIAMSSIYIGLTKVAVLSVSAVILMDIVGRRTLLLMSGILITGSMIFISSVLTWKGDNSVLLLAGFCCAVGSYALGWNCVPSVYPAEVLPTKIRTFGLSFVTVVGRIISVTNAFIYPLVGLENPGIWFFVYSGFNVVSLVLVYMFVKETLNKPLLSGDSSANRKNSVFGGHESEREEIIDHVSDDHDNKKVE